MATTTFTLMDTSEDQVFLFLENHGLTTPFGNLYISDEGARSFSLSIENVIKGNAVDFERVTSLDGTFIVNRYMDGKEHKKWRGKGKKKVEDFEEEWGEDDMIAVENAKASKSRMGNTGNTSKKQQEVQHDVFKLEDSIPASEVQENVRTFITHNKGAKWELMKAPEKTIRGKSTKCFVEDGCSLHLEIYSHMGQLAPVYSSENAVGIVLGMGNIGPRLTDNNSKKSLFLSRDGGLNWRFVRDGSHIYEIGDHGALIVIAKKGFPSNYVEFSWDEGDTWEKLQLSDKDLFIENVIIEPNSISQQFMIYGTYAEDYDGPEAEDSSQVKGTKAFLIYTDFSQLHEPQCKGVDVAGTEGSDFELWTPHDGRFGSNKCFLGMTKTYVRRK